MVGNGPHVSFVAGGSQIDRLPAISRPLYQRQDFVVIWKIRQVDCGLGCDLSLQGSLPMCHGGEQAKNSKRIVSKMRESRLDEEIGLNKCSIKINDQRRQIGDVVGRT